MENPNGPISAEQAADLAAMDAGEFAIAPPMPKELDVKEQCYANMVPLQDRPLLKQEVQTLKIKTAMENCPPPEDLGKQREHRGLGPAQAITW